MTTGRFLAIAEAPPEADAFLPLVEAVDAVAEHMSVAQAIETFRRFPLARFLAVVDGGGRPLGAIREQDVRDLLFSPYGHALLRNPGCRWTLAEMIRPCPCCEMDAPPERLIDAFADEPGAEGLILTRRGVYAGLLPAMALLQLAARREQETHRLKLAQAEAVVARGQALQLAFDRFQQDARRFGDALVATAADIKASASDTADQAGLNGAQAAAVAAASEQSTRGIKEIADSSGALALQARSIDGQVRQVKAAVLAVVGEVAASEGKSRSLSAAADEIGDVVDLISGIARRVNMLSINATIEAARAGPAGKGFAVVAGEIKSLAGQAGKATGQIAGRIEAIRLAVAESGEANRRIGGIVEGLDGVAVAISAAVGRQSQASDIIAGSVQQAAEASAEISGHVAELGDRASDAHRLSVRMRDVADALTATAERLRLRVDDFLGEIGAA